ncbi:coiled-coil and C2 domain-containing protein 2A [Wyeomyia smithii]|uniref:coiled-coil and C2 domain-containing protein 2A n=1 Tax=Wyeomyia smithii TaxID=174621 RepID=UPI0024682032|nr:coiled-coil and C2 domain-containing protein 2A [Wyeomyia smithii]XP_055540930.1 coiled-coil and C2 domain-containing protein 2A [Wyeomyia smithii]XP_055540931.1 coiled-coil and C2 domain-containing protein 2A [Wyeomyia smithii]
MSDPKLKSPRKRRSRGRQGRRQSVQPKTDKRVLAQSNSVLTAEPEPTIPRKPKPQLNPDYIREEQEIKTSLQRLTTSETTTVNDYDREVSFFVAAVPEKFYDALDHCDSENMQEPEVPHEKSPSIQSAGNAHDSPTHLASSYIQTEEDDVIERYQMLKLTSDDSKLLYIPAKTLPLARANLEKITIDSNDDILQGKTASKPNLDEANKSRLINRLIEEEQEEWFDACGDLIDLQNFVVGKRVKSVCSKKFVPYYVDLLPIGKSTEQLPAERTIKVLIDKLRFESHPSFDEVVKMRLRLEQLYKQYYTNKLLRVVPKLRKKLDAMRLAMADDGGESSLSLMLQRRELRKQIYQEAKVKLQLEKEIVEIWTKLKDNKTDRGYKLIITNEEVEQNEADTRLKQQLALDMEERLQEEQEIYNKEKQDYKTYLRDLEQNQDEGQVIAVHKPKKPDQARLKQDLEKSFAESFRNAEEPAIDLLLLKNPDDIEGSKINKDMLFKVKFYIDNCHVASTKALPFQNNFLVDFNTSFSIKLTTKIPSAMKIELYEKNRLRVKLKLFELQIPIPSSSDLFETVNTVSYDFSSGNLFKNNESRTGKIDIKVGWLEQLNSGAPSPSKRQNIPKHAQLSKDLIEKWLDEQTFDPNNSEAEQIIETLEKHHAEDDAEGHKDDRQEKDEPFVFNEDLLAFCSEEEINNNERLNMLSQRFNNNLKYKNIKFIPQIEREIEIPEETKIIDETLGTDPIDLQRHRGKKYLKKVYDTITNHCAVINHDKVNDNLLVGEQIPTFGSLSLAFFEIFGPRRPLKPARRSPLSRASIRVSDVNQFKVIVTVVRAFGIPTRLDDQPSASAGRRNSNLSATKFSTRSSNVRPYITISIKDKLLRTSTGDGTNPTWNERLAIPLDATGDQIRRYLNVDLYDEFMEDLLEDDRARPTEVYQRISSKWLGQLRIPISTIYLNQRIEGTFEIKTPLILFGYSRSSDDSPEYTSMLIGSTMPDLRELTHISLFINLEPNVEIPCFDTNQLECVELEQTKTRIYLWYEEYRNEFPQRAKLPLVTLLSGKRVCVTRLLGPITVPFCIDENVERMIRRYVSLIPIHYNTDACSQLGGVWLTNREIMNVMCASPKDLGVLLACFYTSLEYEVYLVLGHSLLAGDCTFVLLREGGEFFLVDPTNGKRYNSTDTYCPLSKIYYIVNQDNVWGNIQKENRVFLTQLDVNRSAYWRPLFNRSHEAPTGCVHDGNFLYKTALSVSDLQRTIERKIMKKVGVWRTHRKTIWNRYISEQLHHALPSLELDTCLETNTDRHLESFDQLFAPYKVNGFPINLPYTNLSTVVAHVKSTGIHLNSDNKVEFALGLYIKDYPSNIYSVWILLLSLTPRI